MTVAVDFALNEKTGAVDETASEKSIGVTPSEKSHSMGSQMTTDTTSRTMDPDAAEKCFWAGLDVAAIPPELLSGYSQLRPSRQRLYSAMGGGAASPATRAPVFPWTNKANIEGQVPLAGVASHQGDDLLRSFNG